MQISVKNKQIRIIAGYGPQEYATEVVREQYRNTIEDQIERGNLESCLIFLAEDANSKLGRK